MSSQTRYSVTFDLALESTEADTEAFSFGDFAGGVVSVPAGSSVAALTFYANGTQTGTYIQLYDSANNPVARTVAAGRAYALPDECFAARWLKIVSDVTGEVEITLKS